MAIGVDFILRASTDSFTAGVATANNAVKGLKQQLREFGAGQLAGLIGVGGLIRGFTALTDSAQKTRDEFEKLGQTVPDSIRRVAEAGDNLDSAKKTITSWATTAVAAVGKVGEAWGYVANYFTNGNRSIEETDRIIKQTAQTARDAEIAEKNLAASREANNPDKIAAAEKKLADARRKNFEDTLSGQEKINALMEDYTAKYEEANKLPKETVKYKEAQIELENQLAAIQKLQTAENAKQVDTGLATVEATQQTVKAAEDLNAVTVETKNEQLEQLAAQKAITDEMQKQADLADQAKRDVKVGSPLGGGSLFGQASNASLETIIAQEREAIRKLQGQPSNLSTGISIAQRQTRLNSAQAELDFRTSTQQNLNVFGEAGARRMYAGDPLNFDNILSQLRSASGGLDDSKKTQVAIGDIRDVLVSTLGKK